MFGGVSSFSRDDTPVSKDISNATRNKPTAAAACKPGSACAADPAQEWFAKTEDGKTNLYVGADTNSQEEKDSTKFVHASHKKINLSGFELDPVYRTEDFLKKASTDALNQTRTAPQIAVNPELFDIVHAYPIDSLHPFNIVKSVDIFVAIDPTQGMIVTETLQKYFGSSAKAIIPLQIEISVAKADPNMTPMNLEIFAPKYHIRDTKKAAKRAAKMIGSAAAAASSSSSSVPGFVPSVAASTQTYEQAETTALETKTFDETHFTSWCWTKFNVQHQSYTAPTKHRASQKLVRGNQTTQGAMKKTYSTWQQNNAAVGVDSSSSSSQNPLTASDNPDLSCQNQITLSNICYFISHHMVGKEPSVVYAVAPPVINSGMYPRMLATTAVLILKELRDNKICTPDVDTPITIKGLDQKEYKLNTYQIQVKDDHQRQSLLAWFWLKYAKEPTIAFYKSCGLDDAKIASLLACTSNDDCNADEDESASLKGAGSVKTPKPVDAKTTIVTQRVPAVILHNQIGLLFKQFDLDELAIPLTKTDENGENETEEKIFFVMKPLNPGQFEKQKPYYSKPTGTTPGSQADKSVIVHVSIVADVKTDNTERWMHEDYESLKSWATLPATTIQDLTAKIEF